MQKPLLRHPACQSSVTKVVADALRYADGRVKFVFMATGDLDQVAIPARGAAVRTDQLWQHTCFEAFLSTDGASYVELNFSPSGAWAAYRFESYRSAMAKAEVAAPAIKAERLGQMLALHAEFDLGSVTELDPWEDWSVGLSAIIEEKDGSKSYWALAHPPGKPDFHHRDCFAAKLAPDASL